MPRVETVISHEPDDPDNRQYQNAALPTLIRLSPSEINAELSAVAQAARPGPGQPDEEARILALAKSMMQLGQLVPILVVREGGANWVLVDGMRRFKAAQAIERAGTPFPLTCLVQSNGGDLLHRAVHANLKRRGLNPLQFAYLVQNLRELRDLKGAQAIADFLGCSRAQVTQHEKLLTKPKGMDATTYAKLIQKIALGEIGAETAFYTLTKVEPEKAREVLARAEDIAISTKIVPKRGPGRPPKDVSAAQPKVEKKHVVQAAEEKQAVKKDGRKTKKQSMTPRYRADWYRADVADKLQANLGTSNFPKPLQAFIKLIVLEWLDRKADPAVVLKAWKARC